MASPPNNIKKIPCQEIDEILSVKELTKTDVMKTFMVLRTQIKGTDSAIDIASYRMFIVKNLLVGFDTFIKRITEYCNKETEEEEEFAENYFNIIRAVYTSIISLYPVLDFNFVCHHANLPLSSLVSDSSGLEGVKSILEDLYSSSGENLVLTDTAEDFNFAVKPDKLKKKIIVKKKEEAKFPLKDELSRIEKEIKNAIIGQEEAINEILLSIKLLLTEISNFSSFFFVGPPGNGKTLVAKTLGKAFTGNFYKINCAEYSSSHEYAKLIGSPPGYIGHSDKSVLAEKAEISNSWVFLFDEIEKAHPKFYDFLLSLLDDGTITDNMGRVLDFSKSIFIFTSNEGIHSLGIGQRGLGFGDTTKNYTNYQEQIEESIKKHFSPEFLDRIDKMVFFKKLTRHELEQVTRLELVDYPIRRTIGLIEFILSQADTDELGARRVGKLIKRYVGPVIADALLEQKIPKTGKLYSTKITSKGKLVISNIKI